MISTRLKVSWVIKRISHSVAAALLVLTTFSTVFALQIAADQTSDVANIKRQIKQADKMYRQAIYPEAEKILRNVVENDPKNTAAKLKLAHVLLKRRIS